MPSLIDQLATSLKEDNSDECRKKWARYIIKNKIELTDLVGLLDHEMPVSMRFIWLVGDLCEHAPNVARPSVIYFYSKRNQIKFANFNRSLAKMFWLAGIPEEIEGAAIDEMFKWLLDPKVGVSAKNYSLSALLDLTNKYPEVKNELKIVIEDQLDKNSSSFEKTAMRILKELEKPKNN